MENRFVAGTKRGLIKEKKKKKRLVIKNFFANDFVRGKLAGNVF